jgi:cytochrome c biogenesis protein CcmG/thiol:disulfide interchange protein DsbE
MVEKPIIMKVGIMSKANLSGIALAALMAGGALWFTVRPRALRPVVVGEPAPAFTMPALRRGSVTPDSIRLSSFRQKVVVLNFWATWCPPCVEETPSLNKFAAEMENKGVTVVGVSVDQDPAALTKFAADYHLSFLLARDPDQIVAARYGTFKFPETYILDRDGKVAEKIIGAIDWQDPRIAAFVGELVGLPERATAQADSPKD